MSTAEKIIEDIVGDIIDRKGIGDEWEQIDKDIQEEIKEAWIKIFKKHLIGN